MKHNAFKRPNGIAADASRVTPLAFLRMVRGEPKDDWQLMIDRAERDGDVLKAEHLRKTRDHVNSCFAQAIVDRDLKFTTEMQRKGKP